MTLEQQVAEHYTRSSLERAILQALAASGKDLDHLVPADLAAVDEFHAGGREATVDFAEQMAPARGSRLLDIGSGIGGPSRYFAQTYQCHVTGIDLTEEYVQVATALAQRVGLDGMVSYERASANALPFGVATFDGAYMMHVGMNIPDKASVFASVGRVLRPGASLGVYDVMRERDGDLRFPQPWASSASLSFVETAAAYRTQLERAGFVVTKERARREFAIEFFRQLRARVAEYGPSPLGTQLLMGPDSQQKIANFISNLEAGLLSPIEIIAQLPT